MRGRYRKTGQCQRGHGPKSWNPLKGDGYCRVCLAERRRKFSFRLKRSLKWKAREKVNGETN